MNHRERLRLSIQDLLLNGYQATHSQETRLYWLNVYQTEPLSIIAPLNPYQDRYYQALWTYTLPKEALPQLLAVPYRQFLTDLGLLYHRDLITENDEHLTYDVHVLTTTWDKLFLTAKHLTKHLAGQLASGPAWMHDTRNHAEYLTFPSLEDYDEPDSPGAALFELYHCYVRPEPAVLSTDSDDIDCE